MDSERETRRSKNPRQKGRADDRPSERPFEHERQQFRALILSNPNYFGNLKDSPFQPVQQIQLNTSFESIGCVGFQPQFERLEAVIFVHQPFGYGGGICSNGTPEYVRFYLSRDNGASWDDLGMASFNAYDIPTSVTDGQRLEYAVSLQIDPAKRFCYSENICLVRAILSWNVPPPPNSPNFVPVWGDVHNTHIQIDPLKWIVIRDVLKQADVKLPPEIEIALDLEQPVPAATPKELSLAELQALYKDKGVEPHRFALPEINRLIQQPALAESLMAPGFAGSLGELNWEEILPGLFPTDGSTRYEELECVGLNPNQDTLVGIIRVKQPNGYSGGPCTAGSREYVTFWADFNNNGIFETCLGTTSVQVYDMRSMPREGLEYAVFLPVDLSRYRQPCEEGPRVVRIRAILSWQVPPPCFNPNYVPVWGNREETLIHIKPGRATVGHTPLIETVGSMDVGDINPTTGLASGLALLAGFTAQDSPFGGEVVITGRLANPTDVSSGAAPLKYKVLVSEDGGLTWQPLTNSFQIGRSQLVNGIWTDLPNLVQTVDGDGYYTYREDLTGGPGNAQIFVQGNVLARWQTSGQNGMRLLRIEAKDAANITYLSSTVRLRLDNAAPTGGLANPTRPHITITSGGGACADFTIGDVIEGTYAVSDEHFGSLNIRVEPALGGTFTAPVPLPRTYPIVATTGEAGTWRLDTSGMPRCGYVIRLIARDRTIVNSGFVGFSSDNVVGLCLKEPSA